MQAVHTQTLRIRLNFYLFNARLRLRSLGHYNYSLRNPQWTATPIGLVSSVMSAIFVLILRRDPGEPGDKAGQYTRKTKTKSKKLMTGQM